MRSPDPDADPRIHANYLSDPRDEQILLRAGRSGPPLDYLRVNGQPYVVGESAERHGTPGSLAKGRLAIAEWLEARGLAHTGQFVDNGVADDQRFFALASW